ncbi:uncharacterized protein [Nicotiana sylvestris]|uniref:uncharacterized protein n=1 Tax=Nicotiana sylvestris TaxID=4096 RepID=UPI00388C49B5
METDCIHYVRKCHRCQIYADMIKIPPNELNATISPWSFAAWGIDVIGPIEPFASNGHRAFNKRVKPRQFTPGQLVLKKIFPHQDEAKGKFSPKWQGPYMVHRVLTGGALVLAEIDGEVWPKPINSDAVKRYYV